MDKDPCDHIEEIAKEMYYEHSLVLTLNVNAITKWEDLPGNVKNAWREVAQNALGVIGLHAAKDIKNYAKEKFKLSSGWWKWVWAAVGAAGALFGALNSCTSIDSLVMSGEKGSVKIYKTPDGKNVIVLDKAKVEAGKK